MTARSYFEKPDVESSEQVAVPRFELKTWLRWTVRRPAFLPIALLLALTQASVAVVVGALSRHVKTSSPANQNVQPTPAAELKSGKAVERELSGGESHSYRIALIAGQYLHVVIDQRGIDVVVALFAPDAKKLVEVDSPNDTNGPEPVSWIAETTGTHPLEVRSFAKDAKPGRYEVKIEILRKATSKDRHRIQAEKNYTEGLTFAAEGTAESLRKAFEKLSYALTDWRAAGERRLEAATLNYLGRVYSLLGENQKALECYNLALAIRRQVGDRNGEAVTLNNMGLVYHSLGEMQKAVECYNRALPLSRQVDRSGKAAMLNNIGSVYDSLGEKQKALEHYNQALPISRQVGDHSGEAATLNNIGLVYSSLGEMQKALEYYGQALPISRQVGDRSGEAATLNNIGRVYDSLGEKQKALEHYNQTLPIRRQVGDRGGEAVTLNNIGLVNYSLGEKQRALEYFKQALAIRRQIVDRSGEAVTLNSIGLVYYSLGEEQKALGYFNQALPTFWKVGDRLGAAGCLSWTAAVERDLARLTEAHTHIQEALRIVESVRSTVVGHGLRSSFVESIQPYYSLCVDVLMQMHKHTPSQDFDSAALQAAERGRARSLLEMLVESRADIRQGVDPDLLERERSLQQQLAAKSQHHIELAGKDGTDDELETLDKEIDRLRNNYEEVEAQIRARSPKYAALTQPEPLNVKQIQDRLLDSDTLLLEYALGEERSYLWVVSTISIASYELPKRSEIEPLAKLFSKLASGGGQIEPGRAVPVTEDPDYRGYALSLSRILLGPAASSLGEKRLLIVADGALEYVPFAALPDPAAPENQSRENPLVPLLVKHEIVSAPSASAIDVLRNELKGRKPAARAVAVIADPVFSANDPRVKNPGAAADPAAAKPVPSLQRLLFERAAKDAADLGVVRGSEFVRLPGTRREAEQIVSLLSGGQYKQALDFEASKATASGTDLSQYRYVHFATHGLVDANHPELTGVVLSMVHGKGEPVDGFLAAREVYNLNLPAEMVVLSACRTALGKQIRGEGLVGLTRGFMYAGAARVVASLWKVDDDATAELMTRFYTGILKDGKRPADALRTAQLEMWKQKKYRTAYYWAAFVLQGEWR